MIAQPWMLLVSLAWVFVLGALLVRITPLPQDARDVGIDGLRGFLAPMVMFHHMSVWHGYLSGRDWFPPDSHAFHHAGEGSVVLFFMITAFLFWRKIIRAAPGTTDWSRLYLLRVFRLAPLYLFVVAGVVFFAFAATGFQLREPLFQTLANTVRWTSFTILGNPDINGLVHTKLLVADVTWSLRFEWFFYLVLPLLAFLGRRKPPLPWLLLGIGVAVAGFQQRLDVARCVSFLGGIAAVHLQAPLSRVPWIRRAPGSVLLLVLLTGAIASSLTTYAFVPLLLYSAAFAVVVAGANLFGAFALPAVRTLGEMSYSVYLVHGMVLWTLLRWCDPLRERFLGSVVGYWGVAQILATVVVIVSWLTWRWIERPGIQLGHWLAARLPKRKDIPVRPSIPSA